MENSRGSLNGAIVANFAQTRRAVSYTNVRAVGVNGLSLARVTGASRPKWYDPSCGATGVQSRSRWCGRRARRRVAVNNKTRSWFLRRCIFHVSDAGCEEGGGRWWSSREGMMDIELTRSTPRYRGEQGEALRISDARDRIVGRLTLYFIGPIYRRACISARVRVVYGRR